MTVAAGPVNVSVNTDWAAVMPRVALYDRTIDVRHILRALLKQAYIMHPTKTEAYISTLLKKFLFFISPLYPIL